MNLPRLILASASPRRAVLLRELELDFEVLPGHAPEVEHEYLTPREICQLNAYRKARIVAKQCPDALVIGADTVVCLGPKIYGKPANREDAAQTLLQLQGRTHGVITGVCLVYARGHRQSLFAVATRVTFKRLTLEKIQDYLKKINPLDKAGAYAIQEHGDLVVKKITGSYSNVVGLPLERLASELRRFELPKRPSNGRE
jgi:septum formation protein